MMEILPLVATQRKRKEVKANEIILTQKEKDYTG
jgi:hypothetical protein